MWCTHIGEAVGLIQSALVQESPGILRVPAPPRRASRYGQPDKTFTIGLGGELWHTSRLVYLEGLDVSGDNASPIGAGCRVRGRDNDSQPAFPAPGHKLAPDAQDPTVSPYAVKQP